MEISFAALPDDARLVEVAFPVVAIGKVVSVAGFAYDSVRHDVAEDAKIPATRERNQYPNQEKKEYRKPKPPLHCCPLRHGSFH